MNNYESLQSSQSELQESVSPVKLVKYPSRLDDPDLRARMDEPDINYQCMAEQFNRVSIQDNKSETHDDLNKIQSSISIEISDNNQSKSFFPNSMNNSDYFKNGSTSMNAEDDLNRSKNMDPIELPSQSETFQFNQDQLNQPMAQMKLITPVLQVRPKRNVRQNVSYNQDESPMSTAGDVNCKCNKSHCLQLYCSCFHNRKICSSECSCVGCFNDDNHQAEYQKAIESIKAKEQRASHHDLDSFDTKTVWGCKCKKTKCKKGYCECYIRNKKCTSHCQCSDCQNKRQVVVTKKIQKSKLAKTSKKN